MGCGCKKDLETVRKVAKVLSKIEEKDVIDFIKAGKS